jgi:hypothetical protein
VDTKHHLIVAHDVTNVGSDRAQLSAMAKKTKAALETDILNNELYIGRLIWNRQTFVKDPATGKRVARPNPEQKWIIEEVPELRIVDDALWNKVKDRQDKDPLAGCQRLGSDSIRAGSEASISAIRAVEVRDLWRRLQQD